MKNKKNLLSIIIFFLVILILGIPFYKWGFKGDDWSNLYNSVAHNFKEFINLFHLENIEALIYPSNITPTPQNFLKGLFRPLSFIYYFPQYLLFKTNEYGYYLITILLHAINSVIFFNILSYFSPIYISFFSALLFAFHPNLWGWLGWTSAQTYQIELLVLFLLLFFLKKYIDSKKLWLYLISCLLFASNLFLKEQCIIMPIWIIPAIFFYYKEKNQTEYIKPFLISSGYWIIAIFYLIVRIINFPIVKNCDQFNCEPTLISFLNRTKERFFDLVTYISDMYFLSWMPNNHQIIKGSIIILFTSILIWLFIKNSKKPLILFLLFSTLIFSWPAILIHYQPRYIYISIIFFILALNILILFNINLKKIRNNNNIIYPIFTIIILLFSLFLFFRLKTRELVLNHITNSFKKLAKNTTILNHISQNKPLCFISLTPNWIGSSKAQAIWFLTNKNDYPIYEYNIQTTEKTKCSYLKIPTIKKNYFKLNFSNSKVHIKSLNKKHLQFIQDNKITNNLDIPIKQKYLDKKPIFIIWNSEIREFEIIKNK